MDRSMVLTWVMVVGLFVGGAGIGIGVTSLKKQPVDTASAKEAEAIVQLSDLDLLKEPCSDSYIQENGNGLCREMFCWAQTNSKTGEASGISCDAISNINNTITILDVCGRMSEESDAAQAACHTAFRERK